MADNKKKSKLFTIQFRHLHSVTIRGVLHPILPQVALVLTWQHIHAHKLVVNNTTCI